jgi:predicted membrane protein
VNDSDLIRVLDKGQLTTLSLLIALRIYVLVAIPIVGYAFVHALRAQR